MSLKPQNRQSTSSITLWPEQEEAVEFILHNDTTALFFEQRTGKTFVTIGAIERMPRKAISIVIVCFLNNKETTWRDKLAEFLPWLFVTSDWDEFRKLDCPKLLLIHFEQLVSIADKLKRYSDRISHCFIDESHRLKDRGSKLSRAAARLRHIKKKTIMTGTSIEKNPKDLWGQFKFLNENVLGTWQEFENEFFNIPQFDWSKYKTGSARWKKAMLQFNIARSKAKFKSEKMPKLIRLLKPYCRVMEKEDVGVSPPIVKKIVVPISGPQRLAYGMMKRHGVIKGNGWRAMAEFPMTAIMKRRQIASGFVYDDDNNPHVLGHAKLNELLKLVNRLPKPIVIFGVFRPELDTIAQAISKTELKVEVLHGRTSKKLRPKLQREFQRAQYDVLVCQQRTGGVGIDLWKSSHAIVHSFNYSRIDFDQMISRLDLKGKKPATIYILCADETIDIDLFDLVIEKGLDARSVMRHLKRRLK